MRRCVFFAIAVLLGVTGCTTVRLNRFNSFAQAGKMYVTASQTVLLDAGSATVDTDSAFLIAQRPEIDKAERKKLVVQSNGLLRQRLQLLHLVRVHAELLQQYFQTLAALADPKAGESSQMAAENCYKAVAGIGPMLKDAKLGGQSLSDFLPAVTAPVIAQFKAHALNQELHARSEAITKELALQQAAFDLIVQELKTDTQEQQNLNETASIDEYAADAPLPPDWASQRAALLSAPASVASAEAASKAAAQLRKAFTALVENKPDSSDLSALQGDISNVIATAQGVQGEKAK
jgi:hypothetical protein